MAFKSNGAVVESVVFNGRKYNRYPESSNPAHRRYFSRSGHRLHRDVWMHHNGTIQGGMHIHHIDGNTSNNDISNLACITSKQHWDGHRVELSERNKSPEQLAHLDRVRHKAAEWHRSEAGRAWHKEHAKVSIRLSKPRVYVETAFNCVWCGKQAMRKSDRKMYCCVACQSAESKHRLGKTSYEHPYHASCIRSDC